MTEGLPGGSARQIKDFHSRTFCLTGRSSWSRFLKSMSSWIVDRNEAGVGRVG
jgi:hypothetical protein